MGEGGIKGGAVDCPNTLEHTSRQQTSNSSPANIPPNPSRESSPLGTIMGEGGIKGGAMGEGGIEQGAVNCPDTPQHTSSRQTSSSPADIPSNPSRESPPLGMIMGEGGIGGGALDCPDDPNILLQCCHPPLDDISELGQGINSKEETVVAVKSASIA